MKWVASRLDEDPRDEARTVVEGGRERYCED